MYLLGFCGFVERVSMYIDQGAGTIDLQNIKKKGHDSICQSYLRLPLCNHVYGNQICHVL